MRRKGYYCQRTLRTSSIIILPPSASTARRNIYILGLKKTMENYNFIEKMGEKKRKSKLHREKE